MVKFKAGAILIWISVVACSAHRGVTEVIQVREQEVSFQSGALTLQGTVVSPTNQKSATCLLLLPGSGPTDRDGNQPGLQTDFLKQLAESLGRRNVITFRFDKRAVAKYSASWPATIVAQNKFFTFSNFVNDAAAALKVLERESGGDRRCSVLGHSEGGIIALRLAQQEQIKSLVLAATPGRTLAAVIETQLTTLLDAQSASKADRKFFLRENHKVMNDIIKTGTVPQNIHPGLRALYPSSAGLYLQELLGLNPAKLLAQFDGNVSILIGVDDAQVNPSLDADVLYATAAARPRATARMKKFPKLNHLFLNPAEATGKIPSSLIEEIVGAIQ